MEFKISSALKDLIGRELITDDLIAIFELVKNSYDAQAKNVKIIFENIKSSKNSKIYIIDNGTGMSKQDIIEKWLFVGYSEHKFAEQQLGKSKKKKDKQRLYAGAKGIGRFSCDRLGSILKVYTSKSKDENIHKLEINWNKFEEDQNKEFQKISLEYNEIKLFPKDFITNNFCGSKQGTVLEISNLNSLWDRKKLQDLKRYLQRLINPNQVSEKDEFSIILEADEFIEDDKKEKKGELFVINGKIKNLVLEKLNIKTTFIDCCISKNGKKIITTLKDKGIYIFRIKEDNKFSLLKDVGIKLSFLSKQAKATFKRVMGIDAKNYGSVFLFKNGFRVHPYGNENDDWLELDRRKTQGMRRYLATRELIGRIEINGYQPELREVTSRDGGLVRTNTLEELKEFFVSYVLVKLESYVVKAIDWDSDREDDEIKEKKTEEDIKKDTLKLIEQLIGSKGNIKIDYNKEFLHIYERKEIEKIPETIKNLEKVGKEEKNELKKDIILSEINALKKAVKTQQRYHKIADIKAKEEIKFAQKEIEQVKELVKEEEKRNLFLKSITSTDLEHVQKLHHHIGICSNNIYKYLDNLKNVIQKKDIDKEQIEKIIKKISFENNKINSITKFATKANFNVEGVDMEEDLVNFINQYLENIGGDVQIFSAYDNTPIDIKVKIQPKLVFKSWFKPIEISMIFDNLISNSVKAKAKEIFIELFSKEKDTLIIKYEDNGNGINDKIISRIFEYGTSTTDGSGLGMFHVKDIISQMNGEIIVKNLTKGAQFVITFRREI